ncbi:hypothetical protein GOODEAATRI_000849 [Goodea atripinnis]|uniref:Small monomeric GTPase n=6 Tax=Goodeidae TaxID=28758 RepID=A0ABV0MXW1_9TELE
MTGGVWVLMAWTLFLPVRWLPGTCLTFRSIGLSYTFVSLSGSIILIAVFYNSAVLSFCHFAGTSFPRDAGPLAGVFPAACLRRGSDVRCGQAGNHGNGPAGDEMFVLLFQCINLSAVHLCRFWCLLGGHGRRTSAPRMPEQSNDYRVVVFGAGGVGKSSLVLRFVKGTFRDTYIPTVEDTYRQVISCDKSVCTLQITDTTGSHQFPAMQRLSISKGHAFILVFSITSRQSLEELKPIYQQILAIKGSVESIPIMLVGNKSDETAQREVEMKVGEAQATSWKCAFMETSAKTNTNVKELFQELLALEKKRDMSLSIDGKRSGKQKRADKLKGKCSVM